MRYRQWYMAFETTQLENFALFTVVVKGHDQKLSGYKFIGLRYINWPMILCSVFCRGATYLTVPRPHYLGFIIKLIGHTTLDRPPLDE
jgi:hypothetical protein